MLAETNRESARYRLLDSVRLFANERLTRAGRDRAARDRMLRYYADLAARLDREWYTPRGALWLDRLHESMAGVRAAMQWSLDAPDRAALGLEIAVHLRSNYSNRVAAARGSFGGVNHISESDTVQRGNVDHAAPDHSCKYCCLQTPQPNFQVSADNP